MFIINITVKFAIHIICLMLTIAMAISLLCGCVNTPEAPTNPNNGTETPNTPDTPDTPDVPDELDKPDEPDVPKEPDEPDEQFDSDGRKIADTSVEWNMILVNPTHILPEGFQDTVSLTAVQGNYKMDSRVAQYMIDMISAANEDGITLTLCSAFRTHSRQQTLYENRIKVVRSNYPSYTEAEVLAKAATINAYPGTSEHETGLAADIVTPSYQSLDSGFANTDAFRWLIENCYKYGFIMRYAKDKQDITNIIYEPWHYRYVGVDAATEIMSEGICLEEYLGILD